MNENKRFSPTFFKTGVLEAFFEKNSALEWPTGYQDSLTPEQRYTPIRMLFNNVEDTFTEKNILALNNFNGFRKADGQLIVDRSCLVIGLCRLRMLELISTTRSRPCNSQAADQSLRRRANRHQDYPENVPSYSEKSKFEHRPRARRAANLTQYAATPQEVAQRLSKINTLDESLVAKFLEKSDSRMSDILSFTDDAPADTYTPYTDSQLDDMDARRRGSFLDTETATWSSPFKDSFSLDPTTFGDFAKVPELNQRMQMSSNSHLEMISSPSRGMI